MACGGEAAAGLRGVQAIRLVDKEVEFPASGLGPPGAAVGPRLQPRGVRRVAIAAAKPYEHSRSRPTHMHRIAPQCGIADYGRNTPFRKGRPNFLGSGPAGEPTRMPELYSYR